MATTNADAWQQSGARPDRFPPRPPRPDYRSVPMDRSGRPVRGAGQPPRRPADRGRAPDRPHPADRGRPVERGGRPVEHDRYYSEPVERPRGRPSEREREYESPRGRAQASQRGGRLSGMAAVIGIFLITLAGAAVDSFIGMGLGMITLVALVGSTVIGTLAVRRRDLASVVIAPPLVFVAVAGLNIALAPSAALTMPTVATLLIRGFPTMAIATGAALVLGLIRLIARR
jgi:hypothetical protein